MSAASWASIISSTVIGAAVVYVAYRQWRTERDRLVHDRFEKRFAVYKETDDFIRKAHTRKVCERDIVEFGAVAREAYFLFDEALGAYLENKILAKGQEIWSMKDHVVDPVDDTRKLRELTDWMRQQRIPAREKFAPFLRSAEYSWGSTLSRFHRPDRPGGS